MDVLCDALKTNKMNKRRFEEEGSVAMVIISNEEVGDVAC